MRKLDEIRIEELKVFAHHGVYEEETKLGQNFYVNAVLFTDIEQAGQTDELSHSTDYGQVCHFIYEWMQENTYKLLEAAAEQLAAAILLSFPLIVRLDLEIRKPQAPIGLPFKSVSVKISRGWHEVYLSVGSNMGDRRRYIENAIEALKEREEIIVTNVSDIINTEPYGGVEQDDFLNGAIAIKTLLSPEALLTFLHEIEAAADRQRNIHWGPRTLDLDILFYDDYVYESEQLVIPHVDLQNREFVLKPMAQIAPNLRHPLLHKTVQQMLDSIS